MKKIAVGVLLCISFINIALSGVLERNKQVVVCLSCHGEKGISALPRWPNLAGQHQAYLLKQLRDYQSGVRTGDSMPGLVASLTEADLQALSRYFAKQPPAMGKTPKRYLARGQALYRGGDMIKHITACIACHGPKGEGNGEAGFPRVSGQQADYMIQQLKAFKEKQRHNDLNAIMRDISGRMSNEDMTAVAYYMQGLW